MGGTGTYELHADLIDDVQPGNYASIFGTAVQGSIDYVYTSDGGLGIGQDSRISATDSFRFDLAGHDGLHGIRISSPGGLLNVSITVRFGGRSCASGTND